MALEIRRARPEDRPAVLEICSHTWEGGDYIPLVWEEWLSDQAGPLFVATLDGRVVALEKVTWTSPTEVWLEGMRVHPDYRRAGIATALFRYSLRWAAARGARIARLATGSDNQAVHRMVAAVSFRLVHRSRFYEAAAASGETLYVVRADEGEACWHMIERSPAFARASGLYVWNWAWRPLTRERFLQHVECGEVWAWKRGRAAALAVVQRVRDPDVGMMAGFWAGTATAVSHLLWGLRSLALEASPARTGIFVPEDSLAIHMVQEAGYSPGWEGAFWIFEGNLPGPEQEGPGGDPPGQAGRRRKGHGPAGCASAPHLSLRAGMRPLFRLERAFGPGDDDAGVDRGAPRGRPPARHGTPHLLRGR